MTMLDPQEAQALLAFAETLEASLRRAARRLQDALHDATRELARSRAYPCPFPA